MKLLFIQSVESRTIDDPCPYVMYTKREELHAVPLDPSKPLKDYCEVEHVDAITYITAQGKEVNICMTNEVKEVLGLSLDQVRTLTRCLYHVSDMEDLVRKSNNKLEEELKRISDLKWYQRLAAVFFGYNK